MRKNIVLTLTGSDRLGIVESVTKMLLEFDSNVEASRMARLGGEFAMLMLFSTPEENLPSLERGVQNLAVQGFKVTTVQTDQTYAQKYAGWLPYEIDVRGADHEGIIHQVAAYLLQHGINIESMDTGVSPAPMSGTPIFTMTAVVMVPPSISDRTWGDHLEEVANQLDVDITVKLLVKNLHHPQGDPIMPTTRILRLAIFFVFVFSLLIFPRSASADSQTITVDTTLDSNDPTYQQCTSAASDCSLRGAISRANNFVSTSYTIQVPAGTYTLTIPGKDENSNATGDLDITTSMILQGAGMDSSIIQAAPPGEGGIDRVLEIVGSIPGGIQISRLTFRNGKIADGKPGAGMSMDAEGSLTLTQVAFRDNVGEGQSIGAGLYVGGMTMIYDCVFSGNSNSGEGGGIYQGGFASLNVYRSLFTNNSSNNGGAFANNATSVFENVTISGNTATNYGGGISQWNNAELTLRNVTIANNTAPDSTKSAAIWNKRAVTVYNSIISAAIGKQACVGNIGTGHHNIASDASCGSTTIFMISDAQLKPLAFHGGYTELHALNTGSPAIDAGDETECTTDDQRGMTRPQDGNLDGTAVCDIGAYEHQVSLIFMPLGMQNYK